MLGENVERDSWIYALAAHEYYWGDGLTHILTDQEYDSLTIILKYNWEDIPEELQKLFIDKDHLGQGATQIKLDAEQYEKAYDYYSERNKLINLY